MKILFLFLFISSSFAQEQMSEIQVEAQPEDDRPTWEDTDKTKVLTGKKNRQTKINYLPQIQTDNLRQHMSQQPNIFAPEQATEPWTIMNYRGFGTPQEGQSLLILQDGLPVSLDMYGQADNYYSPPAALMESIQVIGGGGALIYGPQPSGTVNYLSPTLSNEMKTSGRANLAMGSFNLKSTLNSISGSSGNTSYWAGYFRKQGDGLQRSNGDFYADYLQFKAKTFLENNLNLKYSFQGYDSDFGIPGGMALTHNPGFNTWGSSNRRATRRFNRLRIARAQLMVGIEKKINNKTYFDSQIWGGAYRRYNKTQSGSGFGKYPTLQTNTINTGISYSLNAEARIAHEYNNNLLSLGFLTYNTQAPSKNERGDSPDSNHGITASTLNRTTRAQAIFAENKFNFSRWSFVPGLRYEHMTLKTKTNDKQNLETYDRSKTYNIILGGIGTTCVMNDTTQAFLNISQGFKPIGFEDVLSQGNPNYTVSGDIKPSYNYFYDIGIRGDSHKFSWDTSFFVIHRQNILASSNNVLSNGSSARYFGIDSAITVKDVIKNWDIFFNTQFLNAKYLHGDFNGNTPAHAPSALIKYGLIYKKNDFTKASILATFVNEHFSDDDHTSTYKVPSYSLFDFLIEQTITQSWSMNFAVNNLLDRHYYSRVMPTGVMPTMGRNFYAGLNYRF